MPCRGVVFAKERKYVTLGMLVDATIQEKAAGFPGWVQVPTELHDDLLPLHTEGLAEAWTGHEWWWRATHLAINRHKRIAAPAVKNT